MINYKRIKTLKDKHYIEVDLLKEELEKLKAVHKTVSQVLEGTLHEVRRFSSEISGHSEQLARSLNESNGIGVNAAELSSTIFYTSGMLAARLAFADLELNPAGVGKQTRFSSGIYKKFEKSKHILSSKARAKGIKIRFVGSSFYTSELLQAFELVPFVLFENAIKYSPENEEIIVDFDEPTSGTLVVKMSSVGPMVSAAEIPQLVVRGSRGGNALKSSIAGDGLGLYLVNLLCALHDVELNFISEIAVKYSVSNVPYSKFNVILSFRR